MGSFLTLDTHVIKYSKCQVDLLSYSRDSHWELIIEKPMSCRPLRRKASKGLQLFRSLKTVHFHANVHWQVGTTNNCAHFDSLWKQKHRGNFYSTFLLSKLQKLPFVKMYKTVPLNYCLNFHGHTYGVILLMWFFPNIAINVLLLFKKPTIKWNGKNLTKMYLFED